jgi:peptidyl-prolyl cis-trans isomerase D
MFDLFRSRAKAVRILLGGLLLLVALSMLTYLVPSYNTGGGSPSDIIIAEIGKDTITTPEVQQVIQNNLRNQRLPPSLMPNYIPQFINSMVTERALAYEAKRMGFKVSDADVAAAIPIFIPQLFEGGKFAGNDAYAAVLAQQNLTIEQFEADVARQLLVKKLQDVALEGIVVTPQEIEQEYKRRNEKVKVEYVKIAPDKLRSEVQATPEELRQYYTTNKALYKVPEKRSLGILVIDQAKLEQTIQPTDADLLRTYNANKDSYRVPERVNIRHILLKTTDMNPQQEAAVKAKAEGLLKQIRGGADFAELAKKYSEDPGSASKGGEYDGVVRGQMVPEFEKAAFSLKPGQVSDLVKTQYGYHIIQVLSHEDARLKPFAEVKAQLTDEYRKQRVNDLMQTLSDKAEAALTKDPQHPEKVAADLGVQYVKAPDAAPGAALPVIGASRDFDDSVSMLKKGEVSQPVLVTGNKIALAVCTDVMPAHPAAFEEVQDKVREAVLKEKVNRLVDQKANQLAEKARANGGDLQAAAKSMGLEVKTSAAVDRSGAVEGLGSASVIPDAFTAAVGSIFGPISIPEAKAVGKVLEHIPADMAGLAAQRAAIRDEIKNRKSQDRSVLFAEGVRQALIKEGKVKIHQDVVNRLLASYRG